MIFNKIKELKAQGLRIGITFSQFDLLHAGHIAMLSEAKNHCDYLICGLQNNAKWDRPEKNEPIQTQFKAIAKTYAENPQYSLALNSIYKTVMKPIKQMDRLSGTYISTGLDEQTKTLMQTASP